jgi:hypothetical protein
MYPRKPIWENPTRREELFHDHFFPYIKYKYKERETRYVDVVAIMAKMATTGSSTHNIPLLFSTQLRNKKSRHRNETPTFPNNAMFSMS